MNGALVTPTAGEVPNISFVLHEQVFENMLIYPWNYIAMIILETHN